MKLLHTFLALGLAISGAAHAAGPHGHEGKPLHGGVVAEAKDLDYEFVARTDRLQLYVRDHGKPVNPAGAAAKVTLLAGGGSQEVPLQPMADRLEAAGSFQVAAGTKAVAVVALAGKSPVSVRFVLK